MKFSLIIATLGREKELYDLFESLDKQTYKNFEVIVIDQNKDDRVFKCVQKYMKILDIKYKKSLIRGGSYNRNIGIKLVEGDVVTFTDDDCTYNRELLENLVSDFNRFHDFNIMCYEIVDKNNNKKLADFPDKITDINTKNIFKCAMNTSTFIKYKNINDLNFDEKLGVGAEFGSCEDSDLIYRLLNNTYKLKFIPKELIYHPCKEYPPYVGYTYGLGLGAFVKKTIKKYHKGDMIFFYIKEVIKAFLGIFIRPKRRAYYWNTLKGRIVGFIKYK
ncbi:TPA: glycosyltransferase family 2 protein [Clostridium perfringens]|uniref:glycosyltransferase family A protein n=1 Tax=Clostridia TaxID=186801 RepID=UPI0010EB9827|nr:MULTISPECIES: glycosyltransferase family 2 protein [Clostridiaceae]EJT5929206.1 glycosyltransferase family 2 protein [Clostridium perfringens]EJT6483918.1 glycosyltransferase family 2 protein [Clostridium perfringens]EJT6614083.1 glycosyltransferase family 2 protein [Clostridium perfringens]MBS5955236.1 glycosyltransferase family 2 protein [Paraclostridium bifermentans]MDG6879459.1 GalNAc(5)-diNAcBac-PP-undecaprenol beta-13-glucosyltransferase [Clostridium perfringens]